MDGTNDGSPSSKLHTRLRLWEFPDCYIFEPIDGLADLFLSVSRANGTMNLVEALPPRGSSAPKLQTVYGVIGVLNLWLGAELSQTDVKITIFSPWVRTRTTLTDPSRALR